MGEGKIESNGIKIWYEYFGDRSNPTVLLIMGASAQAMWWRLDFINPIVDAGYHVIRFDNRDMGLSTWIDNYKANPYTLNDMAADSVGLMDALKIKQAHVVGASMGGMIAQLIAINYPERVLSMTSIMSTYWMADPDIPAMTEKVQSFITKMMGSPPQTHEEMVEMNVAQWRILAGSRFPFDEKAIRVREEASVGRGHNPRNSHGLATMSAPSRLDSLRKLSVPTLVIHGDEDPIVNYPHGIVCAKVIPGAKLFIMKGVGHEIPPGITPEVVSVILGHIGSVEK